MQDQGSDALRSGLERLVRRTGSRGRGVGFSVEERTGTVGLAVPDGSGLDAVVEGLRAIVEEHDFVVSGTRKQFRAGDTGPMTFGKRISEARKHASLSQGEFLDRNPGILPDEPERERTLDDLEWMRRDPRAIPGLVEALATALDIDHDVLRAEADAFTTEDWEREQREREFQATLYRARAERG